MNSSTVQEQAANASSQVLAEFFCPVKPIHIWDLSERTMFKIAAAITIVICPVAIILNILVILAVKLRRELKEHNSNILLASLAVADVLMGVVSMPLTICLDVLVLVKRYSSVVGFCRIAFVNDLTLYVGGCSSTCHLAMIAWERYVAIRKWREYKVIVTRGRIKKYAVIAWLVTMAIAIPPRFLKIGGVPYKYLVVVNILGSLPGLVCVILVGYFYIMVYLGVRKRNVNALTEVRSLVQAKLATKVAKTTAILTAPVLVFYIPSLVYLFFGEAYPALRRSSYFRWSMMMTQLNSVINPVLYCYRDRRYRDAMLEMLRMKKTTAGRVKKHIRRIGSVQSVEDVPEKNRTSGLRIGSCGSIASLQSNHGQVRRERRTSVPSLEMSKVICVDVHQPKMITRKPGIQDVSGNEIRSHNEDATNKPHASRIQPSVHSRFQASDHSHSTPNGSGHHHHQMVRSKSLDESALFEMIGSQHKCRQEAIQRSKTAPVKSRNKRIPVLEVKIGVTRDGGRKSHLEDNNDQFLASRFKASLQRQPSTSQPKGPTGSRHHYRELVRSKSLDERAVVNENGSQQKYRQEAIRRPKRLLSMYASRNVQMPDCSFTRNPGIKFKSGVTRKGNQRHLEDTSNQPQVLSFKALIQSQSSSHECNCSQDDEIIRSKPLDERASLEMVSGQHTSQQEATQRPKTSLRKPSRQTTMPELEQTGYTSKL